MIPPAHGGRLVERQLSATDRARREGELRDLPKLHPSIDEVFDAEKIAIGAYSPLDGFQGREAVESIVEHRRLPGGLPFTIPIVLAPGASEDLPVVAALKPGDHAALLDRSGGFFAVLRVEEKFPLDKGRFAERVFGTQDPKHPNVADLLATGPTALAGSVDLVRRLDVPSGSFELTPREVRAEFEKRKWTRVAAYQCRNPPHTAHEYLQRVTLEREDVDGLFVHPVVGRLKKGDYRSDVILACYDELVKHYYPKDRVLLSSFTATMRYAGPNAAFFYAIVRKNYGCGLYIVGRDQAGVGTYYDPYACHRIFDELDAGVVPLRYLETFFCRRCGWMASPKTCPHPKEDRVSTAQTLIREKLKKGEPLPSEILRPEVAKILATGGEVLNE